MRNPLLLIFVPVKAASNMGCFGVFIGFIYIVILAGIVLSVAGKMLQSCSFDYSDSSTQVHYPHTNSGQSYSESSTTSSSSAISVAKSLHNQGYTIGKIRKYLKNNGYGDYRRKEIREMINN